MATLQAQGQAPTADSTSPTDHPSEDQTGAQAGARDPNFVRLEEMMFRLEAATRTAVEDLRARVEQAGGVASQAGGMAQAAGQAATAAAQQAAAMNSMAPWAEAAQAAGQPAQLVAPTQAANVKPPAPAKFKGMNKEPRILEWTHQAGQFLMSAGLTETVQGVFHITNYLTEDAAVWWRLYCQRVERGEVGPILNWWTLRILMLEQFTEINRLTTLRDQYDAIKQTGSVQAYVTKFQSVILELPEKSEEDRVHKFLKGLKPQVQVATRTQRPQTLIDAMKVADEADRAIYDSTPRARTSAIVTKKAGASGGKAEPMQLGAVSLTPEDKLRCQQEGLCYNCMKPGHAARDCRSGKKKGEGKKGKGRRRPSQGN